MTAPTSEEAPVTRRRRRPPRALPLLAATFVVVAALIAWYLLRRPRLMFTNELTAPIWLAVGQRGPVSLAPGATQT